MARRRLASQDHSLPLRFLLRIYQGLASLGLAILVIGASAVLLGWATLVEGRYGAAGARFGIYGTWWFAALNLLLALNVLAAALIRFPWKKQQTGFLITHAGILVLLVGCLLSRLGGIDAQMPVFEGRSDHIAFEDTQHFELKISAGAATGDDAEIPAIQIPFASGPFNWDDYGSKLGWLPWSLARRDRGVIYDRDGVRLEVLDYYANGEFKTAPPLQLRVKSQPTGGDSHGGQAVGSGWIPVELAIRVTRDPESPRNLVAVGSRETLASGPRIAFWAADSWDETEAFLKSRPEGPLGESGQLVFYARGQVFHMPVESLPLQRRVPLGNTGLEVQLDNLDRRFLGLALRVFADDDNQESMALFADMPEFNRQARNLAVFGTYWADTSGPANEGEETSDTDAMLKQAHQPRIDVVHGSDGKLYYRTWNPPEVGSIGPFPDDDSAVMALETDDARLMIAVSEFVRHDSPGLVVEPLPYVKKSKSRATKQPWARCRLTVDGSSQEFWLKGMLSDPHHAPPRGPERKIVPGDGRRAELVLRRDQVDVGFRLYLHDFKRKLDPGTSMASHYSSLVDLRDRDEPDKVLQEKVLITLNEPVSFADPHTGRSYRIYQESFAPALKPGNPDFDALVDPDDPRDELFLSWLTVNYDPGRGLKYFGSLLIVAGIAVMFYMKAYFFKPRGAAARRNTGADRPAGPDDRSEPEPEPAPRD